MQPNILFIMADQFRADAVGRVGGYTRTPNLDRLAASGVCFGNAFANSAECIPSRLSLATGLYPHQTGVDRNVRCTLHPNCPNWMQAIAAAGYRTSVFGKTHLHPHEGDIRDRLPLMHRYGLQTVDETTGPRAAAVVRSNMTELWEARNAWEPYRADLRERFATKAHTVKPSSLPLDLYYDCYVGRVARTYLENLDGEEPWFCWVSFGGPHEPWDAPEPYASMYSPDDMGPPLPSTLRRNGVRGLLKSLYGSRQYAPDLSASDIAAMRANYAGNVSLIDDEIGTILDTVRRRGEITRTLVVFTSDHGEMNGDHGLIYKANFLDPAIKIPLIIVPPDTEEGDTVGGSSGLVELMDVGATLTDYAGAESSALSQARSLRPILERRAAMHRSTALSEFAGHACVITRDLKVEFDAAGGSVLAFDRLCDPEEQCDVSDDPRYQRAISIAQARLESKLEATPSVPGVLADLE